MPAPTGLLHERTAHQATRLRSADNEGQAIDVASSKELLTAARAEALFNTDLTADHRPSRAEIVKGIAWAVRALGGVRGCAAEVAAAYGEHPETAAPRMRWARAVVEDAYGTSSRSLDPRLTKVEPFPAAIARWHCASNSA